MPATSGVTLTYGTSAAQFNNGRLITMTDGVGSENYSYNNLGQMTQLQKIITGTTYTTNYGYNAAGQLTQITYPSGRAVQQNVDAIGRLCSVGNTGSTCSTGTTFATGFAYNTAFQVTGFSYGNGVSAAFGYSADRLQLTSLSYTKNTTTLLSLAYGYTQNGGNNGQIISITDNTSTQEAGRSVTYTYDALYRLSTAVTTGSSAYPKWGVSEVYDRFGNRSDQNQTFGNPPLNHLLIDAATNRISGNCYDANGNLLAESAPPCPSPTYLYDAENHLVNYVSANTTYIYDGNGLRVKKCLPNCTSPTTTTVYLFSGSKVIAEYDNGAAPSSPTREYIYSGSALLAKIESGATKYYHPDHLSNRVVTDSSGNSVAQMGTFPFGESWYNSTNDKLLFTSYERDAESGNDYAMARFYVNRLGRFSSPDPLSGSVGDPQSLNRFAYVRSDPVDLTDALGLKTAGHIVPSMAPDWGGCYVDLIQIPCGTAYRIMASGAAVQCRNNYCGPVGIGGVLAYYKCYETGCTYVPSGGPGSTFSSEDQALIAGALYAQNQSLLNDGNEQCGMTYSAGGEFSYTAPQHGNWATCQPLDMMGSIPAGEIATGGYHSHGEFDPNYANERFSGQPGDVDQNGQQISGDIGWTAGYPWSTGLPISVATPGGNVIVYYPGPGCQTFFLGGPAGSGTTIRICQ